MQQLLRLCHIMLARCLLGLAARAGAHQPATGTVGASGAAMTVLLLQGMMLAGWAALLPPAE